MTGLSWWFGLSPMQKHRAKQARAKALLDHRAAILRKDTRGQNATYKAAVSATCEALKRGA